MGMSAHEYCPVLVHLYIIYITVRDIYHDLILVPISYLVTDIPRIDSFGYKARQKDEVQNCVLLTSATYALQEDVQG